MKFSSHAAHRSSPTPTPTPRLQDRRRRLTLGAGIITVLLAALVFTTVTTWAVASVPVSAGASGAQSVERATIKFTGWRKVDPVTDGQGYYAGYLYAKGLRAQYVYMYDNQGPRQVLVTLRVKSPFTGGGMAMASMAPDIVAVGVRNVPAGDDRCFERWNGWCLVYTAVTQWRASDPNGCTADDNLYFFQEDCRLTVEFASAPLPGRRAETQSLTVFWQAYHSDRRIRLTAKPSSRPATASPADVLARRAGCVSDSDCDRVVKGSGATG